MTSPLHCGCNFSLIFQGSASQSSWQYFPLLVNKSHQKLFVFVVNVFYSALLETAIFLFLWLHILGSHVLHRWVKLLWTCCWFKCSHYILIYLFSFCCLRNYRC